MPELNTAGFNGEFKTKMMSLVEEQFPQAQAIAFGTYIKNAEELKRDFESLQKNHTDTCNLLFKEQEKSADFKKMVENLKQEMELKCKKESDLLAWEAKLSARELKMDLEIAKIQIRHEQEKGLQATNFFYTVFKCPVSRTEIQRDVVKVIPPTPGIPGSTDNNGNTSYPIHPMSGMTVKDTEKEVTTKTEE